MTVLRFTPERYEANQKRREAERRGAEYARNIADHDGRPYLRAADIVAGMGGTNARSFTLRLPVPQSVNHNTLPNGRGGRYLTDEHRAFRQTVALAVYDAKIVKLYGRLRVYIRLNSPCVDVDNVVKPLLDSLQRAGAIENDRHVDDLHIVRSTLIPLGALDVEVQEL